MLNECERLKILTTIQTFCKIGCFPATIDQATWKLLPHSETQRSLWPSVVYFGCFVSHAVYTAVTFLHACFVNKNTPVHELTIHGILALGGPLVIFWYHIVYIEHVGDFGGFLRMTLTGNIGGNLIEDGRNNKRTPRLKEYTLRDLIAIMLPYTVAPLVPAYLAIGIFYPKLQLLLYAGLPQRYQTWMSFSVLLVEEMRYIITFYVIAVPLWILQLISTDLVNNRLQQLVQKVDRITKYCELKLIYKYLRHVQLYVTIINGVNRYIIFTWKVFCITICIGTGYCAIAHFASHPVFGVLYYIILINSTFIYTFIYGQAYKSQVLFEEVTRKALPRLNRCGYRAMAMCIVKRQMRSVPRIGIKVGEFHMIERQSVPIFVDYVLSNIVAMLVVYKH